MYFGNVGKVLFGLLNKILKIEFEFPSPKYLNYVNNHCSFLL